MPHLLTDCLILVLFMAERLSFHHLVGLLAFALCQHCDMPFFMLASLLLIGDHISLQHTVFYEMMGKGRELVWIWCHGGFGCGSTANSGWWFVIGWVCDGGSQLWFMWFKWVHGGDLWFKWFKCIFGI